MTMNVDKVCNDTRESVDDVGYILKFCYLSIY